MSKAGKMHGEIISEEETAKGLGFASVDEFRRWQTDLGRKNSELEFALSEAKRESGRFRWHGMRMEFMLGKAEAYLQTELDAAKHHVAKLENSGVMAEGVTNENSEMAAVKAAIGDLEKLLLGIRVVCNREVDWKHTLKDWLDRFNKSNDEIAADRIKELTKEPKPNESAGHDAMCYCAECLGGDPPRPEDEAETQG